MKSTNIPVHTNVDSQAFLSDIYPARNPVILRNVPIGACTSLWTSEYLQKHGGTKEVSVHVSPSRNLNFISRNFIYRTLPFSELVERANKDVQDKFFIEKGELYYLRSLGSDQRKKPADIQEQFPELAKDVQLPNFFPEEAFFSSVLRIASPKLCLWTHYDVMDNMLIQVTGRKKAVLFHPNSVEYLYLQGDKSQVTDIENPDLVRYPEFLKAEQHVGVLEPGDILFIPALWFHNMTALDFGVAVNVFWRHLEGACYEKSDVYGNKDPVPAAKALAHLHKAMRELQQLPTEYREFYGRRMIEEIKSISMT
ncbi:tRNA wybutosine-synthesizing protein 5-like [Ornithodoros turicata]|uniref:tRNA wybutosine-synthesizing protein 5-like n=1 Tax=Ornithodoros turicata TaxID=34597 RepID=UPI00313963B4